MARSTKVWIFQANPSKYNIAQSLQAEQSELWNLRQHQRHVTPGHRVLIWMSGRRAGIYALGTVTSGPDVMPDTSVGMGYWIDKEDGRRAIARVHVRYDLVFLERPLLKAFLQLDPTLWDLQIIRNPRGTNFPVTDSEWAAVKLWLDITN